MLNKIIIMGRLTTDPELKQVPNGQNVCNITLAVDRDYKNQDGSHETDFIDVVTWRNTAEFVSKYFNKGRMMIVEGRLQIRNWTDKDGNNRRSSEIVAENVYFGDSKSDHSSDKTTAETNSYPTAAASATSTPIQAPSADAVADDESDWPF